MKMNKKKVFVTALAVSLIAILSFSTIAWFNAKDEITNTFKVADSDDEGTTPDFSVEVFETDADGRETVEGNLYEDILPGDTLEKDPTVRNTGSYDMYVRALVTLSDAKLWMDAAMKYDIMNEYSNYESQVDILETMINVNDNRWRSYEDPIWNKDENTITYVYYYWKVVEPGDETTPVFTEVEIPTELQQVDMGFGTGVDFTIDIKAEAIQARNMIKATDDTTKRIEAYYAFKNANWEAGTSYDYEYPADLKEKENK